MDVFIFFGVELGNELIDIGYEYDLLDISKNEDMI